MRIIVIGRYVALLFSTGYCTLDQKTLKKQHFLPTNAPTILRTAVFVSLHSLLFMESEQMEKNKSWFQEHYATFNLLKLLLLVK